MVLVTKPARRQGLGSRLLQRCLAEIEARGVAAGLDATELGRPVYLPLGFRDVYPLSRWRAEAGSRRAVDPPPGVRVRAADGGGPAAHRRLRRGRSGFARGAHPRAPARAGPGAGARRRARGRQRSSATRSAATVIAPCTSARSWPTTRRSGWRCSAVRWRPRAERVILDVPDRHRGIRRWLADRAPPRRARFMRMLRGPFPAVENAASIFALAGPELA